MSTTAVAQRLKEIWETPDSIWGKFATVDHKEIGIRYLITAFVLMCIGGVEALCLRVQLARPDMLIIPPEMYDQLFSMHGITMIFFYAYPILAGFSNYLIPLMIGSRDMAYPRLNAFTYWSFLFSAILMYIAPLMGQGPHAGWFSYAPYTLYRYSPGHGMDFYAMALIFFMISLTAGGINFITTILKMRAPGMSINKMPLMCYSTLTISFAGLFAAPALIACCVFLELDRRWGTHFFSVAGGGNPVLWQQLFWFFGHPWVYIIFLPATAMVSMIIPVFSRRPIVGYSYVAVSTMLTGVVGFSVWLHHMFTVGMSDMTMSFFSAGSMMISLFTIVQIVCWVVTMWKGRLVTTTAMHYAMATIAVLIVGGLNGVVTGIIPVDWQAHNTYFVVGHIHYVLIGGNMFPVFAGLYYWYPKMTGRMLSEKLGKVSFWVMFLGFNVGFFPMQIVGLLGMPRRIYTYPSGMGWAAMNYIETVGAFVLAGGILLSVINFIVSRKSGRIAGRNPWNADTLEWALDSPPEPYSMVHFPTVATRHPLWDQHDEEDDPDNMRVLDGGRLTYITSWLDAEVVSVAKMPEETLAPMLLALMMFLFFLALAFQLVIWACGGFGATLLVAFYWLWPRKKGEEAL